MTDSEQERPIRSGEPTTMRFPGIGELEHVEGAPEEGGLTAADQATVDALREGTALLVVLRGPNTGARFLLDADEVSSGRPPDSDIFLDAVTVTRQRVDEAVLHTGDEVQIGKFRLVFYAGSGASSA